MRPVIKSVRSARLRYEQFQLEILKEKEATEKQLQRKIVTKKFQQVKQKKIRLQESVCEFVNMHINCPSMLKKRMTRCYLVDKMTDKNLLIVKDRRLMT